VVTILNERNRISVPSWVADLESFRHALGHPEFTLAIR
jgi:hypothetical protein